MKSLLNYKDKNYKKFILIFLFFIFISLCSCTKEENKYYLELEIKYVYNDDARYIYLKENEQLDEPFSLGLDTNLNLSFYAVLYIKNSNGTKIGSFITQHSSSYQDGLNVEQYDIIDKDGKEIDGNFTFDILSNHFSIRKGRMTVPRIAGLHKVKFTMRALEAYGIEKTSFYIEFLVEEDKREDAVEIVMSDLVKYEKIDLHFFNKDNYYDIYYCKQYPIFQAKIKESGDILSDILVVGFRKLDEFYFYNMPNTDCIESGIYLCQVRYKGSTNYRAVNYYCYIIF